MKITTGQLLSLGTGKLCCDISLVYEALNFLTGDNIYTHVIPRAMRTCEPWVRKQHAWLATVDESKCNTETVWTWLAEIEATHGKTHEIEALPEGIWQAKDPVAELMEYMEVPRDRIITVAAPAE